MSPFLLVDKTGAVEIQPSVESRIETKDQTSESVFSLFKIHPVFVIFRLPIWISFLPFRWAMFFVPWRELFRDLRSWRQGEHFVMDFTRRRGWAWLSQEQRSRLAARFAAAGVRVPQGPGLFLLPFVYYRVVEKYLPVGGSVYVNGYLESSLESSKEISSVDVLDFFRQVQERKAQDSPKTEKSPAGALPAEPQLTSVPFAGRITKHKEYPLLIVDRHEDDYLKSRATRYQKQMALGLVFLFSWYTLPVATRSYIKSHYSNQSVASLSEAVSPPPKSGQHISYALAVSEALLTEPRAPLDLENLWGIELQENSILFLDQKTQQPHLFLSSQLIGGPNAYLRNANDVQRSYQGSRLVSVQQNRHGQSVVDVWDLLNRQKTHRFWIRGVSQARLLDSEEGSTLVVLKAFSGTEYELQMWSLQSQVRFFSEKFSAPYRAPRIVSSPSGRWLVLVGSEPVPNGVPQDVVTVIDPKKKTVSDMTAWKSSKFFGTMNIVLSDEKNLMALSRGQQITVLRLPDLELDSETTGLGSDLSALTFVNKADRILVQVGPREVGLFDYRQRSLAHRFVLGDASSRHALSFSLSQNDRWLLAADRDAIWGWDLQEPAGGVRKLHEVGWAEKPRRHDHRLFVGLSPNGEWLSFSHQLINLKSGRRVTISTPARGPKTSPARLPASARPKDCLTYGGSLCLQAAQAYAAQGYRLGEQSWLEGACLGGEEEACQKLLENKDSPGLAEERKALFQQQLCRIRGHPECD